MYRRYRPQLSLIMLAGLLVGLALAYLWLHLVTPFDNGRLQPGTNAISAAGLVVTPLHDGPAGFQAGDRVVEVNGRPLDPLLAAGDAQPVGDTIRYTVIRDGEPQEITITPGPYPLGMIFRHNGGTIIFALLFLPLATFVFLRRPHLPAARALFLAGAALFCATTWSLGAQVSDFTAGAGVWLYFLTIGPGFMLVWIAGFHFALVFPRSLPIVERRSWLLPAIYGLPYGLLIGYLFVTRLRAVNTLDWMSYWGRAADITAAVFLALTLLAILRQYQIHQVGVRRRQLRWLALATLLVGGVALLFYFLPPLLGGPALNPNVMGVIGVLYPLTVAIAILRHNLFDIDTLLNRTLVYGALTTVVVALYITIVVSLGTFFHARSQLLISLIATGIVTVLFQPLRAWLQMRVNRLMFGERDDPVTVFSQLSKRLETAVTPDLILPTLVETISQTLKLPYVAISLPGDRAEIMAAQYGKPAAKTIRLPLVYQGETVGHLLVAPRSEEEAFSAAEMRLFRNIAQQAGTAVHAVRLTADLQRSQQRLVTAREEERRRLRRDLHDGLGPTLAAHMLAVGSARAHLQTDPTAADRLLQQLEDNLTATLGEVRHLVDNLRPPILDQLGFSGAIEACAAEYARNGLAVTVATAASLPPLPAAVEVAAYHIVREGLTNVVRHAQARHCHIDLTYNGQLNMTIRDDGTGLPPAYQAGIGLTSMRHRAAELGGACRITSRAGGGTKITACFPLQIEGSS